MDVYKVIFNFLVFYLFHILYGDTDEAFFSFDFLSLEKFIFYFGYHSKSSLDLNICLFFAFMN